MHACKLADIELLACPKSHKPHALRVRHPDGTLRGDVLMECRQR